MNFTQSISHCFNNYTNFNGRASRSEFWWFFLFVTILEFGADIWDASVGYGETGFYIWIVIAATITPSLSVGARRLHDLNKSGWWQLLWITIIGGILLIIWHATEGENKKNKFGSPIKLQVRGASSVLSDGGQIFDIASTATANGGTRLAFGVNEDAYTWIRSYESGVGSRDLVFAGVSEYGRFTSGGVFNLNNIVQVGTTNDTGELRIGHDGSNYRARIVSNSSNSLEIDADGPERIQMHGGVIYMRPINSEKSAAFVANGSAELYYCLLYTSPSPRDS